MRWVLVLSGPGSIPAARVMMRPSQLGTPLPANKETSFCLSDAVDFMTYRLPPKYTNFVTKNAGGDIKRRWTSIAFGAHVKAAGESWWPFLFVWCRPGLIPAARVMMRPSQLGTLCKRCHLQPLSCYSLTVVIRINRIHRPKPSRMPRLTRFPPLSR